MENNEQDNRQMTVIAAEVERQKTILKGIQENHDSLSGDIAANKVKHTISVLESLLPKEEEQLVNMAVLAYTHQCGNIPLPLENRAAVLFNETFKQG